MQNLEHSVSKNNIKTKLNIINVASLRLSLVYSVWRRNK